MRAMFLEFPEDLNTYAVDTQYMLGSNLLVAPVFDETEVTFYVPRSDDDKHGKWVSWFDHHKTYEPGQWYTETHGFDRLPLLIRPGSVTVVNPKLKVPEDDALSGIQLLVNGTLYGKTTVEVVNPGQTDEVLKTLKLSPSPAAASEVQCEGHPLEVVYVG